MNILNISSSNSTVFNAFDGIAMKFVILMFDKVVAAGDFHSAVFFLSHVNEIKTNKRKILHIDSYLKNQGMLGDVTVEQFDEIKIILKNLTAIKHKPKEILIHLDSVNKFIDNVFENYKTLMGHTFKQSGLNQFIEFEKDYFNMIGVDVKNPETKRPDSLDSKMSETLLADFKEPEKIYAYTLTGDFTTYLNEKKIKIGDLSSMNNENARVLKSPLIFNIPHINIFSTNEIEMIRDDLQKVNQIFKTKIENWSDELATQEFQEENYETITAHYLKEIQPEIVTLQSFLENHSRIKLATINNGDKLELKINIIICDVALYWDYLVYTNTVLEETMQILGDDLKAQEYKTKTCILFEVSIYREEEIVSMLR